jgi:UDP-N-acetylglucosamine/UDP-N-acetylgalactosamine diphosphorylase
VEVVEYSDITPEVRDATRPDGQMRWPFGSIAIHSLAVSFIKRFATGHLELPFHRAKKKIPYVDEGGTIAQPETPNGVKFEMFVFDALRFAERTVSMEVLRDDEFAPVKNATGEDSVETSRRALSAQYARWLEACGVRVAREQDGSVSGYVEIGPLTADSAEALKESLPEKTEFRDGMVL